MHSLLLFSHARLCVHLFAGAYAYVRMREAEIAQMQWINMEQGFLSQSNKTPSSEKKKTDFACFV